MELFKYILLRLFILSAALLGLNEVYKHTFYKDDISKHGDVLENLWMVDNDVDAIYFGESSNFHIPEGDSVKNRISYMLDDMTPGLKIGTVDNAGLHAGTYLALIKNIPDELELDYLIVTMNFRSFDAMWRYSHFENYLAKTERMIEPNLEIINKFLVSLNSYDNKSDSERDAQIQNAWRKDSFNIPDFEYHTVSKWDSAMAWHAFLESNPDLTEEDIPLAAHHIKNFAFSIDTNTNERIHDFDAIMEEADKRDIQVVFVILAENMEQGQKLVGDELMYLMNENRKLLKERYRKKGAIMVDAMDIVPDSCFVDRHWPVEHYNTEGKRMVAKAVKEELERQQRGDWQSR